MKLMKILTKLAGPLLLYAPTAAAYGTPPRSGSFVDLHVGKSGAWMSSSCPTGGSSPINVSEATMTPWDQKQILYRYTALQSPVAVVNTGYSLSVTIDEDMGGFDVARALVISTESYTLKQIVIRTPSEHTFNGTRVPLELQLLHAIKGGKEIKAILAIGFTSGGGASDILDALRQGGLPAQKNEESLVNRELPARIDVDDMFRDNATFWQYDGSLTQPPCSDGVRWFVRNQAIPTDSDVIEEFQAAGQSVGSLQQAQKYVDDATSLHSGKGRNIILRTSSNVQGDAHALPPTPSDAAFDLAHASASDALKRLETVMAVASPAERVAAPAAAVVPTQPPLAKRLKIQQASIKKECRGKLVSTHQDLVMARARKVAECSSMKQAKLDLQTAGAGVTRIEAAARLNGLKIRCQSETQVVAALESQQKVEVQHCKDLNTQSATTAQPLQLQPVG